MGYLRKYQVTHIITDLSNTISNELRFDGHSDGLTDQLLIVVDSQ